MMDEKDALSSDVAQALPVSTTHDELLAKISYHDEYYSGDLMDALRAVVELHKPDYESDTCSAESCRAAYLPCPTIQAIQEQLK